MAESNNKEINSVLQADVKEGKEYFRCSRCGRDFQKKDFYLDKNKVIMNKCKACVSSMIDINSPSTILPIMEEIDIPFIPEEWNILKEKHEFIMKNGEKVRNPRANQPILGKYIGKMKLKQFIDYSFKDTPRFMEAYEENQQASRKELHDKLDSLLEEGYDIEAALQKIGGVDEEKGEVDVAPGETLTKVQSLELKQKWGQGYTNEELIHLETFYGEMHDSYDINSASHEDYLKQICKLSLRMHSLIDSGIYDEYQKVANMYDRLMKSAKFTASQEKEEDRFIDSISEMVRLCEEQGFIPVYHMDEPQDIVDITLQDFENYVSNLVATELNLDVLFEKGLEQIKLEEEKDQMGDDDALFYDGSEEDASFMDIEEEIRSDSQFMNNDEVVISNDEN